jgi:hypothetical protein
MWFIGYQMLAAGAELHVGCTTVAGLQLGNRSLLISAVSQTLGSILGSKMTPFDC